MKLHGMLLAAMVLGALLAGCIGQFDVQQTEPLRIRLEDGTGATNATGGGGGTSTVSSTPTRVSLRVDSDTVRERTVVIEKEATTEVVVVDVTVIAAGAPPMGTPPAPPPTNTSTNTTTNTSTNTTGTNTTSTNTTTGTNTTGTNATTTTTVQNIVINVFIRVEGGEVLDQRQISVTPGGTTQQTLEVNVKGKDNVVIVTQALEGSADVEVRARGGGATG